MPAGASCRKAGRLLDRADTRCSYGGGFWLNLTHAPSTPWGLPRSLPGAPSVAYFGRGYLGQYLIIVPSRDLIVVAFGASHGSGDAEGIGARVRDVLAARH